MNPLHDTFTRVWMPHSKPLVSRFFSVWTSPYGYNHQEIGRKVSQLQAVLARRCAAVGELQQHLLRAGWHRGVAQWGGTLKLLNVFVLAHSIDIILTELSIVVFSTRTRRALGTSGWFRWGHARCRKRYCRKCWYEYNVVRTIYPRSVHTQVFGLDSYNFTGQYNARGGRIIDWKYTSK